MQMMRGNPAANSYETWPTAFKNSIFGIFITQNREQNGRKLAPNQSINTQIEC
jgi:hypothetical protein